MHAGENDLTIEQLIKNLQADDHVTRLHAATVLGSLGNDAEAAVPFLIDLMGEQGK